MLIVLVLGLVAGCGCSPNPHPELRQVSGQVVFQGEPVADATVAFYHEKAKRAATGRTDAAGNFYLTTFNDNDGALPGEHTVVVSKTSDIEEDDSQLSMDDAMTTRPNRVKVRQMVPVRYTSPDTSPLRLTVAESGPNKLTVELEKK